MKKLLILVFVLLVCLMATSALAEPITYTGVCNPITINTPGEHTIILNGVTIEATSGSAIEINSPATELTIILKNNTSNTLTGHTVSENLFNGSGYAGIDNNGVDLIIRCESVGEGHICNDTCGKLIVNGGNNAAGIGGDENENFEGTVIIKSGNITANGGSRYGAGIGSGENGHMNGTVEIVGGIVTANGGADAAGIGSGCYGHMKGTVKITGGIVTAQSLYYYGSGIGGGYQGNMEGTVEITGGTVTAIGSSSGAGIGSGYMGEMSGDIKISGGTIVAEGGLHAPGIGGSSDGHMSGNVIITGGTVTAIGEISAAGIGGGHSAHLSGTVKITGGNVTATGYIAGIGGGEFASITSTGKVIVEGGTVNAEGSVTGIGSGGLKHADDDTGYMSGSITISGGTVTASGLAGIGGERVNGTITITGGTVTAAGKNHGTGIGSGRYSSMSGSIVITGGVVTATGSWGAFGGGAGIGCGYGSDLSGVIAIKGGIVTAISGHSSLNAIGAGTDGIMTEDAMILVDPLVGVIEVKAGNDEDDALELEGSPYASKTDMKPLLNGMPYAQFRPGTPHFCSGGTATCKNLAVCGGCGKTYGELDVNNHVHKIILPAVPATTVSTGLTEGLKCGDCQTIIIPQQIIPMLPTNLPQTGDSMNFVLLAALAVIGMIGMTVIIRKKNEA